MNFLVERKDDAWHVPTYLVFCRGQKVSRVDLKIGWMKEGSKTACDDHDENSYWVFFCGEMNEGKKGILLA